MLYCKLFSTAATRFKRNLFLRNAAFTWGRLTGFTDAAILSHSMSDSWSDSINALEHHGSVIRHVTYSATMQFALVIQENVTASVRCS